MTGLGPVISVKAVFSLEHIPLSHSLIVSSVFDWSVSLGLLRVRKEGHGWCVCTQATAR